MAMSRFSGIVGERMAAVSPTYIREILQSQTATWAGVAQAEDDALRIKLRREHMNSHRRSEKFFLPLEGWSAIPKLSQERYLEGVRRPQNHTVEDVATHAPVSRTVFYNVLWHVLSPKADLATCVNTVSAYGEDSLNIVVSSLLNGRALDVVDQLAELRTTGALVAQIRLLVHERRTDHAFDVACALAQALCYHAVNPLLATAAPRVWNLVSQGILKGLRKGQFQFSPCCDGFLHFSNTLWDRRSRAEALYGIHRFVEGPRFNWATIVDMSRECIRGFATPGIERPDALQSFLEVGSADRLSDEVTDKELLFSSAELSTPRGKMQF